MTAMGRPTFQWGCCHQIGLSRVARQLEALRFVEECRLEAYPLTG